MTLLEALSALVTFYIVMSYILLLGVVVIVGVIARELYKEFKSSRVVDSPKPLAPVLPLNKKE